MDPAYLSSDLDKQRIKLLFFGWGYAPLLFARPIPLRARLTLVARYVGPGACLFGPITIGDDVAVGANAVVTQSLPDGAVALGIPAQIVSRKGSFDYVPYLGMEADAVRTANLARLRTLPSEETRVEAPAAKTDPR